MITVGNYKARCAFDLIPRDCVTRFELGVVCIPDGAHVKDMESVSISKEFADTSRREFVIGEVEVCEACMFE